MLKCAFLLATGLCLVSGRSFQHYRSSDDWDLILFTQNWPVTECLQWKQDNYDAECNSADYTQWTVHGMWPTKLGTKGPGFCDEELIFELNKIESIKEEMAYRWLSIKSGNGEDVEFWKHEWEKHGTCAAALQSLDSELKYFSKGLDWNTKYNMRSTLEKVGLSPGGSPQTIDSLYSNLQSVVGANPFISCYRQRSSDKTFLIDVRLCFDKTFTLIDCDGVERWEDEHPLTQDCPSNTPIYYPDQSQLYQDLYSPDNDLNNYNS